MAEREARDGTAGEAAGSREAGKKASAAARPKPKKGSMAWKRQRSRRLHRGVRWASQAIFFVFAPTLFSAGFSGVKSIFAAIGAGEAVEFGSFVELLVALLGFTILFGRFFCGYACAFGTLGDLVYTFSTPLRRKLGVPDKPLPEKAQRALQMLKYAVLVAVCVLCFLGVWDLVSPYSPWTTFGTLVELSTEGISALAAAVFLALLVGMAFVERFFCQFLCPFGAVFSLMPVMPFSAYRREASRCSPRCGMCKKSCPVDVFPDSDEVCAGECISCGRCADSCPASNIAVVKLGWHISDEQGAGRRARAGGFLASLKEGVLRIRGNEVVVTVVKAALLLLLCGLLGVLDVPVDVGAAASAAAS